MENINLKQKKYSKIIAVIISFFIISLLILNGPAVSALELNLSNPSTSSITQGSKVEFEFTLKENNNEYQNENITIYLNNQEFCTFNPLTLELTNCNGTQIQILSSSGLNYGYGYGYGYGYSSGEYKYKITLDTNYFNIGNNQIYLKTIHNTNEYTTLTKTINVQARHNNGGSTTSSTRIINYPKVHIINNLDTGYNGLFYENEQLSFKLKNQSHTLTINSINLNQIQLTIESTPQYTTMELGESQSFDLDSDTIDDITITILDIGVNYVNLDIQDIHNSYTPLNNNQNTLSFGNQNNSENNQNQENLSGLITGAATGTPNNNPLNSLFIVLILVLLILFILALILIVVSQRKRKIIRKRRIYEKEKQLSRKLTSDFYNN